MNKRTIYHIYNPLSVDRGYYVSAEYLHHYELEDGEILVVQDRVPARIIIDMLNQELESANHHSMMDVYDKLYHILMGRISEYYVDKIFMDIWNNGGLIDA